MWEAIRINKVEKLSSVFVELELSTALSARFDDRVCLNNPRILKYLPSRDLHPRSILQQHQFQLFQHQHCPPQRLGFEIVEVIRMKFLGTLIVYSRFITTLKRYLHVAISDAGRNTIVIGRPVQCATSKRFGLWWSRPAPSNNFMHLSYNLPFLGIASKAFFRSFTGSNEKSVSVIILNELLR